jgi:hypothetical protein
LHDGPPDARSPDTRSRIRWRPEGAGACRFRGIPAALPPDHGGQLAQIGVSPAFVSGHALGCVRPDTVCRAEHGKAEQIYLDALKTNSGSAVDIFLGRYQTKTQMRRQYVPSAAIWPLASSRQKKHISQRAWHSGAYLAGTVRTSSASLAAGRPVRQAGLVEFQVEGQPWRLQPDQ